MRNDRKLGLIAFAAALAIAVLCLSRPVSAEPARRTVLLHAGANLANPHPDQDDDSTDEAGDSSGDATPVPDPQPVA